jgi:hypothetical protein
MKKIAVRITALIVFFVGVGGILPALAQVRDSGAIPSAFVGSYTLGVVTVVGASTVYYAVRKRCRATT